MFIFDINNPTCQSNSKDRITLIYDMNSASIYYCIHIFLFLPKWLPQRSDLQNEEKPAELEVWKLVLANSDAADYFGPGNTIMFRLRANPRKFRANIVQCQAGKIPKTFTVFKCWPDWLSLQIYRKDSLFHFQQRLHSKLLNDYEMFDNYQIELWSFAFWDCLKSGWVWSRHLSQGSSANLFSPLLHYFLLFCFYLTEFCH